MSSKKLLILIFAFFLASACAFSQEGPQTTVLNQGNKLEELKDNKGYFSYKPLKFDKINIKGNLALNGFGLELVEFGPFEDCKINQPYFFTLATIIALRSNLGQWVEKNTSCVESLDEGFRAMIYQAKKKWNRTLSKDEEKNAQLYEKIFKRFKLEFIEHKMTGNLHEEKNQEEAWRLFEQWSYELNNKNKKRVSFSKWPLPSQKYPWFKNITELTLALMVKNESMAKEKIKKWLNYSPEMLIFETGPEQFKNEEESSRLYHALLLVLKTIPEVISDKSLIRLLGPVVKPLLPERLQDEVEGIFLWSSNDIEQGKKSINYGLEFPGAWFLLLYEKGDTKELEDYMKKAMTQRQFSRLALGPLWVLSYTYPTISGNWVNSQKDLKNLVKLDFPYAQYLCLELAKRESLKREMGSHDERYKRAFFQIKREFMLNELKNSASVDFDVYSLALLGDTTAQNLWWMVK